MERWNTCMIVETKTPPAADWLVGGGKMGKLVRSMDWTKTPLGPIESRPQSLRTTVSLSLASTATQATAYVEEALHWLPNATAPHEPSSHHWHTNVASNPP